jgi:hypothetical protein
MSIIAKKNLPFLIIVSVILAVLAALYLSFGHMKHEREQELATYADAEDELGQVLRREADEFRIANQNQQRGILAVGAVVVLAAIVWWFVQRKRDGI